jgi:hypothetical protein
MESIIKIKSGDKLTTLTSCEFCGHPSEDVLGVILADDYLGENSYVLRSFGICENHKKKINALLSGEYDIDSIFTLEYKKGQKHLKLRG